VPWRGASGFACHGVLVLWMLWQCHYDRMRTIFCAFPFQHPVLQACACIPLSIVLLHLTSGLPLLWYYVVQASTVHSGPAVAPVAACLLVCPPVCVTACLSLCPCCQHLPPYYLQSTLHLPHIQLTTNLVPTTPPLLPAAPAGLHLSR
jgi:hypothetical protein